MIRGFMAAALAVMVAGNVSGDDNIGDARRSVESGGGKVYWGKHIDHLEYAKAAVNIALGNGGGYVTDLAAGIATDFGAQIGVDQLNKLVKGETINLNGKQLQGGVVSYNHWRRTVHHFFEGWPPHWKEIENRIPLPNTHQFYLRIK